VLVIIVLFCTFSRPLSVVIGLHNQKIAAKLVLVTSSSIRLALLLPQHIFISSITANFHFHCRCVFTFCSRIHISWCMFIYELLGRAWFIASLFGVFFFLSLFLCVCFQFKFRCSTLRNENQKKLFMLSCEKIRSKNNERTIKSVYKSTTEFCS
jgi:uncharacterized membrane protein YciS (DUF1049 family)